jgi:hypothetical protein
MPLVFRFRKYILFEKEEILVVQIIVNAHKNECGEALIINE